MDEIRALLLLVSALAGGKCALLCRLAWRRFKSPILYWNFVHFAGWAISAGFFSVWYLVGRVSLPWGLGYWVPNVATVLMIIGAFGVSLAAHRSR